MSLRRTHSNHSRTIYAFLKDGSYITEGCYYKNVLLYRFSAFWLKSSEECIIMVYVCVMCVCEGEHSQSQYVCGGQKTTWRNLFPPIVSKYLCLMSQLTGLRVTLRHMSGTMCSKDLDMDTLEN